jgi:SPP1 gp7 family putative phage head morphogenesis protein
MTPFLEAVEYLLGKGLVDTKHWYDLMRDEHDSGFMVAGATVNDVLTDMYDAVVMAREQGTTITEFRKAFDATVQKHGWSYKGKRGWRTRVIYDTNMRQSAMAGRWAQIQRVKDKRPWLRYVAVQDERTRPEHMHWNGMIYRVDDPFWNTHMPMNGWGCRCTVQTLSDRQMQAKGLKPSTPYEPDPTIEKGIDEGFDYNPGAGRAAQINHAVLAKAAERPAALKAYLVEHITNIAATALLESLQKLGEEAE